MNRSCRFCGSNITRTFVDLGVSPLANSYVPIEKEWQMEPFFPLHAYVCEKCFLVQLMEYESPQNIFSDYAYFSSWSSSWLAHAKSYVNYMTERFEMKSESLVVEIASNDGYLLQYFKKRGIQVLGVDPAANVAKTAIENGIPTEVDFFGTEKAKDMISRGIKADLMVANNVLAHVPNINDFVAGFDALLKDDGVITFEFPHILNLIEQVQFDTIYHEHFSYLSLSVVDKIMKFHNLRVFDVQELSTHGGSLRVFVCHGNAKHATCSGVAEILEKEDRAKLNSVDGYAGFSAKVQELKRSILSFVIEKKTDAARIAAYGAPAKGNTLLNYCGIRTDFVDFTVDKNPEKQKTLLPGSHIPVLDPKEIFLRKPDYLIILPWNLRDEISKEMRETRKFGCKFVTFIPKVEVW